MEAGVKNYDEVRREIALEMGWTGILRHHRWGYSGYKPTSNATTRRSCRLPDPLHSAEDAEALEAWLVGQGWELTHRLYATMSDCRIWRGQASKPVAACAVQAADEPDPALRLRRALVEAAWQALK